MRYCERIRAKDRALREFLNGHCLSDVVEVDQWLLHLSHLKKTLGNLNNDVSFVATLLVKRYLNVRFGIADFDAAAKPQGAPGIDVEAVTPDGISVVGELKTTVPYQPGFGAQQKLSIRKDLARLASHRADYRIMFVLIPKPIVHFAPRVSLLPPVV
ncbi:MAG: hypothetical protein JO208_03760 [Alphaproteobacteria bacterium]|nr:hypothetical protein [Alphaproteobacteria bacterium]